MPNSKLEEYRTNLEQTGHDPNIQKYAGLFNGESNLALSKEVELLHRDLPRIMGYVTTAIDNMTAAVDRMITSNESLATSNGRYARALNWLTGALVGVGLLQVILLAWQTYLATHQIH